MEDDAIEWVDDLEPFYRPPHVTEDSDARKMLVIQLERLDREFIPILAELRANQVAINLPQILEPPGGRQDGE